MGHKGTRLRVLLLITEFPRWAAARHWSYSVQLGLEEGLAAHDIDVFTIASPWLGTVRDIIAGKRFDQVWADIVHSPLDRDLLEWLVGVAPVRVALIGESLEYTDSESLQSPLYGNRRRLVEERLQFCTHALAVDEHDVDNIGRCTSIAAMWWPQSIPAKYVSREAFPDGSSPATFCGSLYGDRGDWLCHPQLEPLLKERHSPETATLYPFAFDLLQYASRHMGIEWLRNRVVSRAWLAVLRSIRRRCFRRWLRSLRQGGAVVNLPTLLKAYPGRVVESMAAGRPVVSWRVPNRPRTEALFAHGHEILLFSRENPDELADHLTRLASDRSFSHGIVEAARLKLLRFHTMERRTHEILMWIANGETPSYP